jgi:hypothetical protein
MGGNNCFGTGASLRWLADTDVTFFTSRREIRSAACCTAPHLMVPNRTTWPLWPLFAGYTYRTAVECFEFTELHQALLDATSSSKALEAIEGMLSNAVDPATASHVVSFLVRTQDIMETIGNILRKFPATQQPFAITLHCLSFVKDSGPVATVVRTMSFRKLLRCVPGNDFVFVALLSILGKVKGAPEAFGILGGDGLVAELFQQTASASEGLRCVAAACILSVMVSSPPKDVAQRMKLYEFVVNSFQNCPAKAIVDACDRIPSSMQQLLFLTRVIGAPQDLPDRIQPLPPTLPGPIEVLLAKLAATCLADEQHVANSAVILKQLYNMAPDTLLLQSGELQLLMECIDNPHAPPAWPSARFAS